MWIFVAKLMDHLRTPFPYFGPQGDLHMANDRWKLWDLRCYDNAQRAVENIEIPSVMNQPREAKKWYGKQPGHFLRADFYSFPDYIKFLFSTRHHEAFWVSFSYELSRLLTCSAL